MPAPRSALEVAVGTPIADRPPHRSVRAELPHTAPPLDTSVKAHVGIRMQGTRSRNPPVEDRPQSVPSSRAADSGGARHAAKTNSRSPEPPNAAGFPAQRDIGSSPTPPVSATSRRGSTGSCIFRRNSCLIAGASPSSASPPSPARPQSSLSSSSTEVGEPQKRERFRLSLARASVVRRAKRPNSISRVLSG